MSSLTFFHLSLKNKYIGQIEIGKLLKIYKFMFYIDYIYNDNFIISNELFSILKSIYT